MKPTPPVAPAGPSFEDALAELEQIVRALEAGDIALEDALSRYESGVGLVKHCYTQLRQAEQRIVQLSGEDPDGKPILQTFEHTPADLRRRSPRPDSAY